MTAWAVYRGQAPRADTSLNNLAALYESQGRFEEGSIIFTCL